MILFEKSLKKNAKEREAVPEWVRASMRASYNGESIEHMVRRLEVELEEEFKDFERVKCPRTTKAVTEAAVIDSIGSTSNTGSGSCDRA